jgi:hypothetical protein
LNNGCGFIALLTGISAYLFLVTKEDYFRIFKDREQETSEGWLIRGISISLAFLYILDLLANFHKVRRQQVLI